MIRFVADSNIFVSAMLFGGKPEQLLRAAEQGLCLLVVSEEILLEIAEVLSRKFRWSEERVAAGVARIRAIGELTTPSLHVEACEDQDDDRILEAAIAGEAQYIVSGDAHLLRMEDFGGVQIIRVRDFLELFRVEFVPGNGQ